MVRVTHWLNAAAVFCMITSGYAIYSPGSGLKDVKANGFLTYFLSRQVMLTAGVSLLTMASMGFPIS